MSSENVKPFSVEEARERARRDAMEAARIRSSDADHDATFERIALECQRTAATLREYADMKEAVNRPQARGLDALIPSRRSRPS